MALDFSLVRLDSADPVKVYECFIKGFADYPIRLQPSYKDYSQFLFRNGYDAKVSFGVIYQRMLVGIALNCPSEIGLYNCGLCVLPKYRGGGIGSTLITKSAGETGSLILECLHGNTEALNLYLKLGFVKLREMYTYAGGVPGLPAEVFEVPLSFVISSFRPSHQNSVRCIERIGARSYRLGDSYIAFSLDGEVHLLSFANLDEGMALLAYAAEVTKKPLKAINVDCSDTMALRALDAVGMKPLASQWELALR